MSSTAGRVRMPSDNRVCVSSTLKTSEIWQKSVGYDPYAPLDQNGRIDDCVEPINEQAKGLFALARLTGSSSATTPGSCKRCGELGHLAFQCRNLIGGDSKKAVKAAVVVKKVQDSEEEDEERECKALGLAVDSDCSSSSDSSSAERKAEKKKKHTKTKHKKSKKSKRKKEKKKRRRH